jgi:hypothetical protein
MNKILILLAVIADAALVVNVVHHWDNKPQINIGVECFHTNTKKLNCVIKEDIDKNPEKD